jgi:D-lactate dehydrogenase
VISYDIHYPESLNGVETRNLDQLLAESDIISLHVALNPDTRHIINNQSLGKMKDGVMLINTGSGELIKTAELLKALKSGKIAYLGLDGYEFEKNLFFNDHRKDENKDAILEELISYPNVIVSPHQAFLTKEALQEIANLTIKNLDNWHAGKCSGKACICYDGCKKNLTVI